jgi:hypothetical protein
MSERTRYTCCGRATWLMARTDVGRPPAVELRRCTVCEGWGFYLDPPSPTWVSALARHCHKLGMIAARQAYSTAPEPEDDRTG